ncbi:hypothetical protein C8R45DRAFT_1192190 [Mycena sanguinolenta]|nr:hypothetical protein C8R45DRAFT_1192190 [Mycena sanguinolenta]
MANLNLKDWDQVDHMLRHDQAIEMANILEALCLAQNPSILVLPPTFDLEAELLRDIDWLPSDTEPIDHTGAPAFSHESVLKNAWLHSKSTTLKKILVFQHDPVRNHWLLFEVDLATERMICYESTSQHGEGIHMAGLGLIAKFFKPGRSDGTKPGVNDECNYSAKLLKIQTDGASCGFWMATLAFLIVYGIPLNSITKQTLRNLGPNKLKEYWKSMIMSWRVEEVGLSRESADNFLQCFGYELPEEPQCIARRPDWIRRFNPEVFEQEMNQPPNDPANQSTNMPTDTMIQGMIPQLRDFFNGLEKDKQSVNFLRESLQPEDWRRFLDGGWANDDIVNMFVSVLNYSRDQPAGFADEIFDGHLPPPSSDLMVMTSFFYLKLHELLLATGSQREKEKEQEVLRWLKKADFNELKSFLLPINEPANIHWFLIEIDFEAEAINIYDSLNSHEDIQPYAKSVGLAILASQLISKASGKLLEVVDKEQWKICRVSVPTQDNGNDCGFFTIMAMLHLAHWGEINRPGCPPIFVYSAQSMHKTRVILATTLLSWCSEWKNLTNAKLPDSSTAEQDPDGKLVSEQTISRERASDDGDGAIETVEQSVKQDPESPARAPQQLVPPVPSSVDGEEDEIIQPSRSRSNSKNASLAELPASPIPSSVDGEEELEYHPTPVACNTDDENHELEEQIAEEDSKTAQASGEEWPEWCNSSSLTSMVPTPPPRRRGPPRRVHFTQH